MHPQSTRNEFLRLRVQGLSLAAIGRRLAISKPTAIKWNRRCQSEIAAASRLPLDAPKSDGGGSSISSAAAEVADLTRRLAALKQELFSRALREFPTAALETLAGQYRQRLELLKPATTGSAPSVAPDSSGGVESIHSALCTPQSALVEPIRT